MRYIDLNDTNHTFMKENNVTQRDGKGLYDTLTCSRCGVTGKSRRLGQVDVTEKEARKLGKSDSCRKAPSRPEKVRVTRCNAQGNRFANLTPGSVHETIDPPEGEGEHIGLWVMGIGEPVVLLHSEYTKVKQDG